MIEKISNCPLCQGNKIGEYLSCKDHSISKESFMISKCGDCGFLFTNPRPDEKSIVKYYKSDNYISHSNKSNSLINTLYKIVRRYTLSQKLKLINTLSPKGKLFDYGCGTGHFLQICQNNGWKIEGLETDADARAIASEITRSKIKSDLDQIKDQKYDIITLWHVLEHVHKLHETMNILSNALLPSGKIIVALPNHKSFDAHQYGKHWAAYDLPRHLYHFEKKTIDKLAQIHRLKIVKILPMKFDSYYVSMLSEKYKGKGSNIISSLINAYKSNYYAKKTKEYSSLIYILSK